ncbi:hypothetical protein ARMSODRAFT_979943 [Armillaria solidipes]|uniref:Xylanolytic transcriptional activator regulatory domain-containing protein n=1 Tax=Armillaria solidipes TaxID=1076256 RepID=A0A2H3BI73_9AGAR|nr:hypothetical protein ARMSODRAFT_979943 [Armillaria solidipes]
MCWEPGTESNVLFMEFEELFSASRVVLRWPRRPLSLAELRRHQFTTCQLLLPRGSDLLDYLVRLYFLNQNLFWPLLHRPTFERSLAARLHRTDSEFGALVLFVCAAGSRYSDDPRVKADDTDKESKTRHLNGWKWFIQVHRVHMLLLRPPNLCDLQKCALSVFYAQGCAAPHASWTSVGTGIRTAQDLGAHRRHSRPAAHVLYKTKTSTQSFPLIATTNIGNILTQNKHSSKTLFVFVGNESKTLSPNWIRSLTHGLILYLIIMSIFSAAIVLLLNIWSGRRSGISFDEKKELSDIHKCMKTLQIFEKQSTMDVLYELASVGELPLPHTGVSPSNKREHDSDSPLSIGSESPPTDYSDIDATNFGSRPIKNSTIPEFDVYVFCYEPAFLVFL